MRFDLDVGKDIGRRAQDRKQSEKDDQRGEHDERVRALQRYFDYPHGDRTAPGSGAVGK